MTDRRSFIKSCGTLTAAAPLVSLTGILQMEQVHAASKEIEHLTPLEAAENEDFWFTIRNAYSVTPNIINLNNGGVSPQPVVAQDALDRYVRLANEGPAYYMWQVIGNERENVRKGLASLGGVDSEEIAINRNSSEALETVIFGMNLKEGDEIITTNQDYPNMMSALHQREMRDKIKVVKISIPVPCEDPSIIVERYKNAITPKTKAILICHMINLTGQILPVRQVADMAHEHGLEVICDGAHTFGHFEYNIPDLHVDYFGTSLHKWLCAPFGSGMLWMKKEKIKNIWPLLAHPEPMSEDIRKFENLGTRSFPIEAAIGVSLDFHNGIGTKRKEERLRYLKNYWAEKAARIPKVKLNTSLKREYSCALANFSIEGIEPNKITEKLFADYKIYAIAIVHDEFKGVRVTPHVYTMQKDLDYLLTAIEKIAKG
jgi:selenocysteine lyase/cysteine desulfurase